jgi:hypothetical protein
VERRGTVEGGRRCPRDEGGHRWVLGIRGEGRTRVLLFLLILSALIYVGNQAVAAYVDYIALRDTVQFVVRDLSTRPRMQVDEGKERILAKARELQLPLSERQVFLSVDADFVLARVRWEKPIGVGQYTYDYPFEIEERYRVLQR